MLQDKKQMLHTLGYATFILSFDPNVLVLVPRTTRFTLIFAERFKYVLGYLANLLQIVYIFALTKKSYFLHYSNNEKIL